MKTWRLTKFGLDGLAFEDADTPAPGPGQVLVRMRAFSINYRDLMLVKGTYNPRLRFPFVPLSDGAGEVAAIGAGVTRFKVGDRVAGCFMQRWSAGEVTEAASKSALGGAIPGVAADYVVFEENGLVAAPEHLSLEETATLPCAALTAWHALVSEGRIKAGDVVLTQGTGGVSLFALQFAVMSGARVIATSSSDAKLKRALEMGASDGINYKTTEAWEDKVRELTGGAGCDHVVEVGGAGTLAKSLRAVRMGGRISLIGVLSGAAGTVNPIPILMKNVRVQGIFVGSRAMFEDMNRAIAQHKLKPMIDRTFAFDKLPEALAHMESGGHFGKIVVRATA
ncbi:MAG: NAD(P)-dependent alcohol dehydrogenase [Gemmataceae bacterium]